VLCLWPIHEKGLAGNCIKPGKSKYHINPNTIDKPVSLTFKFSGEKNAETDR
jgi:hypothetical protein